MAMARVGIGFGVVIGIVGLFLEFGFGLGFWLPLGLVLGSG